MLLGTAIAALKDNWFVIQPSANYDTCSQESIDERFLTCDRILDNTVNVLLPLFKPIDFKRRTYSVIDVIRSLMYASCNSISITQTCNVCVYTYSNPMSICIKHVFVFINLRCSTMEQLPYNISATSLAGLDIYSIICILKIHAIVILSTSDNV